VIGIDLAEDKQALAVVDHDVRVLARKTVRVKAVRLGQALDWAVGQARVKGFAHVMVACEPTGPGWLQVQRLCAGRGLPLVCIQPPVCHLAREQQDYAMHETGQAGWVMIARLAIELDCSIPEEPDGTWAQLRHVGRRRVQLVTAATASVQRVRGLVAGGLADRDPGVRPAAGAGDLAGGAAGRDEPVRRAAGQAGRQGGRGVHRPGPVRHAGPGAQRGCVRGLRRDLRRAGRRRGRGRLLPPRPVPAG
jgi:Transposase